MVLALAAPLLAAGRYDPRLQFRTQSTPRFDIHFHQGGERDARRLARVAEDVATRLDATLGPATGRVQVVLVDQDDLPNGWATPLPYNLIEIRMVRPSGQDAIGNTDDWLRLVFTHEYTHIVQLSRGRGWSAGLRRVFGRHPILFPTLTLPSWQIEGLAVFEESTLTPGGRLPAPDFHRIVGAAAAEGAFEPLDRANGGLVDWPAGHAPYAYGGYFTHYLEERYGEEALRRLTDTAAGLPPYLGARAYRRVFGAPLGELWSDFAAHEAAAARSVPGGLRARRLTHHGFTVTTPRAGPDGRVYYSIVNPEGFPSIEAWDPATGTSRRIAQRYLGSGLGFAGPLLVYSEADLRASVALQFDLYATPVSGGARSRLTRGARAADPDVSPDGRFIACTIERDGLRDLVVLRFDPDSRTAGSPRPLASGPATAFALPRWSPDGATIAAERRVTGTMPEVVLVDAATGAVRPLLSIPGARVTTPAWLDDATVLVASDFEGGAMRIYRVDIRTGRVQRLEGTGAIAESPEPVPGRRSLVFVGYTPDGFDLFELDLPRAAWTDVDIGAVEQARHVPTHPGVADADETPNEALGRPYSPGAGLWPRFWTPTAESDSGEIVVGAASTMSDPLGRHAIAAGAGWAAGRARPDWDVLYVYDRWWPTLVAAVTDDTDPWRAGESRTREWTASALLPWRSVRRSQLALAGLFASRETIDCPACERPIAARMDRRALHFGYALDATRTYGYSISRESGTAVTGTLEVIRAALGSDGDAASAVLDVREYVPLGPGHAVLAMRAAGAAAWGDDAVARRFTAAGPDAQPGGFRFGADAIGLLRGFDEGPGGQRAAVVNLDWRVPLRRIERGIGTWPLFARTLHAAVFVDAGHAWTGRLDLSGARVSAGGEISLDAVIGYALPVSVTGGVAVRRGGPAGSTGVVAFGRIGRAF
jgi:hypothetical protein